MSDRQALGVLENLCHELTADFYFAFNFFGGEVEVEFIVSGADAERVAQPNKAVLCDRYVNIGVFVFDKEVRSNELGFVGIDSTSHESSASVEAGSSEIGGSFYDFCIV